MGLSGEQNDRLERMGYVRGPNESETAFHERIHHELNRGSERLRYGTRDWYAKRALAASWWAKTVSVSSPATGVVLVEVWGPAWLPVRVPAHALERIRGAIAPDMPIGTELRVEDGRP